MNDMQYMVAGSAVTIFLQDVLEQAEAGLVNKGWETCSENLAHIKVELNAVEVKEAGGGLKVHVFSLAGNKSDSNAQKITIFAKKTDHVKNQLDATLAKKKEELLNRIN